MNKATEQTGEAAPLGERVRDTVCRFRGQLSQLFVLMVVLLVLSLFSLLFVDPGSTSFVILQLDFIILGITLSVTGLVVYACRQRAR